MSSGYVHRTHGATSGFLALDVVHTTEESKLAHLQISGASASQIEEQQKRVKRKSSFGPHFNAVSLQVDIVHAEMNWQLKKVIIHSCTCEDSLSCELMPIGISPAASAGVSSSGIFVPLRRKFSHSVYRLRGEICARCYGVPVSWDGRSTTNSCDSVRLLCCTVVVHEIPSLF